MLLERALFQLLLMECVVYSWYLVDEESEIPSIHYHKGLKAILFVALMLF